MNYMVDWIAAAAEMDPRAASGGEDPGSRRRSREVPVEELGVHSFGQAESHFWQMRPEVGHPQTEVAESYQGQDLSSETESPSTAQDENDPLVKEHAHDSAGAIEQLRDVWWRDDDWEAKRERKIYRKRTIAMLKKYMQYSMDTGRLPSLLGREFFRAKVTAHSVVTFEDRVIFVLDMERCLDKLDEFSRDLIARHILQEHDRWATARLLHCNEKTVRRLIPLVLDVLSEILLDVGLIDRLGRRRGNFLSRGLGSQDFRK